VADRAVGPYLSGDSADGTRHRRHGGRTDAPGISPSKRRGLRRVLASFRHSGAGFRDGFRSEAAIREALLGFLVLLPVAILLPVTRLEHLTLIVSLLLVVMMELVNSAIEAGVDRVSLERHPLARRAKDFASAAVFVAAVIAALCWLLIAGPVVARWLAA
jgi:diacylglycerol kinase (ATP)